MAIIDRIAQHVGDRPAVIVGATAVSYARMLADVRAAASLLHARGVGKGTKVGVRAGPMVSGQSYGNWVVHLATLWIGARHVSMTETAAVTESLRAGMVDVAVGSAAGLGKIPATMRTIVIEPNPLKALAIDGDVPALAEENAVRINLTSGTTGSAKFIAWDAAMLEARVAQVGDGLALGSATRLYPLIQLRATAGFRYPIAVWAQGGAVLLPEAETPAERDAQALAESNLVVCSPYQLESRLVTHPGPWPGRRDRTIVTLGGRVAPAIRDAAADRACGRLLISYGSTETGSIATGDAGCIDRHPGAVGFVRDGVRVEIIDPSGRPVPAGEAGTIRLTSPLMVAGYVGAEGEAPNDEQWFVPGDIGRLYDDGLLAIEGRESDTFNLGGWKVHAPDLESKVRRIRGVGDVCACVMHRREGDRLTFAIVSPNPADLQPIAEHIRMMLPKGRQFHVVRVPQIPRNAMGKIPRMQIAQRLAQAYDARRNDDA